MRLFTILFAPPRNSRSTRRAPGIVIALGLLLLMGGCTATQPAVLPPNELKGLSVEELMNIEVTSVSRRPEALSKTASAIQVITGEAIRRSGASNLPEALRLASNLQVAQVDARQWAISARGFNSVLANKLLVMIDGRSVYSPLFAGVFWDLQHVLLEDIDRIEVISGPGGTQWGVNAVNGVINVITKDAGATQGLFLEGGGGTELRGFGSARYGATLAPGLYVRAYGTYSDRDGPVLPDGRDVDNHWGMGQGGFRLDWDASDADQLTVQGDLYKNLLAQPGEDLSTTGGHVLGRWSHTRPGGSNLSLQLYVDHVHRTGTDAYEDVLYTYDVDWQHRFRLGTRNHIVWGAGYRHVEDDFRAGTLRFVPPRASLRTVSAFAQDELALVTDRLHLTLGAKIEHTEYTGIELQPNVRLAWTPNAQQILWAALSRAVRTPSRLDRAVRTPALSGSADFDAETLMAYELGYRIQPHEQLSVSLATFYHDYDDIRSVEVNPSAPPPGIVGNGQEGESYGAELTVSYQALPRWWLRAGYTLLQVDIRAQPGSTDPSAGVREAADSDHHLMLHSSLDLPARIEFDTVVRYVSRITNPAFQVPGYAELDARLAWQPTPRLNIAVVGQNLLHGHHAEYDLPALSPQIERGVYGRISWRW